MQFQEAQPFTELTQRHVEESVRCAWRASWTVAGVVGIVLNGGERLHVRCEPVPGDVVLGGHLLLESQGQQPTQVLVVDMERAVGRDVGREDGAVGSVQSVAALLSPVGQMGASVVLVDDAELGDIVDAREDRDAVRGGGILAVHESEFVVWQLLFLGHDVLGQLQQGVFVAPQELTHGHFHKWLDLQNIHDTRHGQAKEPVWLVREQIRGNERISM